MNFGIMKGGQIDCAVVLFICVSIPFDDKFLVQPCILYTFFDHFGRDGKDLRSGCGKFLYRDKYMSFSGQLVHDMKHSGPDAQRGLPAEAHA